MFFGPADREVSLESCLNALGVPTEAYDIVNGSAYDHVDDTVWDALWKRLQDGQFSGVFASPPCNTFSVARELPGGPPVLRGIHGASRYGLGELTVKQKELVRVHNLLAVRASMVLHLMF